MMTVVGAVTLQVYPAVKDRQALPVIRATLDQTDFPDRKAALVASVTLARQDLLEARVPVVGLVPPALLAPPVRTFDIMWMFPLPLLAGGTVLIRVRLFVCNKLHCCTVYNHTLTFVIIVFCSHFLVSDICMLSPLFNSWRNSIFSMCYVYITRLFYGRPM